MQADVNSNDTKSEHSSSSVQLKPFDESEKPILRVLLDDYLREFAELEKSEIEEDSDGHVVYPWFDDYWIDESRTPFSILVDGDPHGFCLLRDLSDHWEVAEYYVAPAYRGSGVGARAVAELAGRCQQLDHHSSIVAKVKPWNVRALKFWEDQGFQVQSRDEEWVTTVLPLEPR